MENKKVLIVFSKPEKSELMSKHLALFGINAETTKYLEDAVQKASEYDLVIMDIDHGLKLKDEEKVELFLGKSYPVFNRIRNIKTPTLLMDTYPRGSVEKKLQAIGANNVTYQDKIILMKELLIIIKNLLKQGP